MTVSTTTQSANVVRVTNIRSPEIVFDGGAKLISEVRIDHVYDFSRSVWVSTIAHIRYRDRLKRGAWGVREFLIRRFDLVEPAVLAQILELAPQTDHVAVIVRPAALDPHTVVVEPEPANVATLAPDFAPDGVLSFISQSWREPALIVPVMPTTGPLALRSLPGGAMRGQ